MAKNSKCKENKFDNQSGKSGKSEKSEKSEYKLQPPITFSFPYPADVEFMRKHELDWEINRDKNIRDTLRGLYLKNLKDNESIAGNLFRAANILLQNLATHGPMRAEYKNYRYDNIHNLYHCHISNANPSYVVIWSADLDTRTIDIEYIGPHENAPYDKPKKRLEKLAKLNN